MSAEEGSQPPTAGADKAQAPKAAATFSSFINKNTTGKKFAPKAARRRPGAAPAAPAPAPSAPETTASSVEPQTEPESSNAPVATPAAAEQLPTPAATQETTVQNAPPAIPSIPEPSTATPTASAPQEPSTNTEPLPTPAPTNTEVQTQGEQGTQNPAKDGLETDRAPERQRTEPPAQESTAATQEATEGAHDTGTPSQPTQQQAQHAPQQIEGDVTVVTEVPATPAEGGEQATETSAVQPDGQGIALPQPRKRRKLPWVAVNHPQDGEEGVATAPVKKTRQPPKARGRKKATADADADAENGEQQDDDEDESQPTRKRPSAKARGKRKAPTATAEDGVEPQPAPKRVRKPRKPKSNETVENTEATEGEAGQEVEETGATVTRKPRQPKRRKRTTTEAEGGDGENNTQPKRKGRPPREPTPSDAEDQAIDPDMTYMDSLASRNIRVGKLSNREREMRKVDWVAVRERRREEDSRPIKSKEEQEAADKALAQAGAALDAEQVESGPRFRMVNGNIELIPDSGTINREAEADKEIAEYETIENQDITARITSRSFMKNNKRFPNEFILPGQGRRWTKDSTDLFYQGLKSFGTDFQMISHMFPGSTRRSIKTKFTREERENPEQVREALQGRSEMATHWDVFLEASQMKEESFVDADAIKRELAEDEARMRELIAVAEEETRQRNLQKAAAGFLDENGNEVDEASKENGKGKKKRNKGKQVAFQEEQGVEIVGALDDDPNWGQE